MNLPWTLKFEEYGGYDCMTSSYNIIDCYGDCITEIDTGMNRDNDEEHEEVIKAKKVAELIVNSVNNALNVKEVSE